MTVHIIPELNKFLTIFHLVPAHSGTCYGKQLWKWHKKQDPYKVVLPWYTCHLSELAISGPLSHKVYTIRAANRFSSLCIC